MAAAYHAPLCLSCASPMADDSLASVSPHRNQANLSNPFLSGSHVFRARSPSTQYSLSIERRKCAAIGKISCAFSNAPEAITACSWNQSVLCSDVPVLVEFWVSWCGPCRMVSRVMDEISREYAGRIKCFKLDADDYPQLASTHGVERIPTVLLFKNGEKLQSITGTLPKSVYVSAIEKSLSI